MAHRCGLAPSEFWTVTPFQLRVVARAHGELLADQHDGRMLQAHITAYLGRVKSFPKTIKDFLAKRGEAAPASVADQVRALFRHPKRSQE